MDNDPSPPSIYQKLSKIQQQLKVPKTHYNDYSKFHYRTTDDIFQAVKPIISAFDCALTITDEPVMVGDRIYIRAKAMLSDVSGVICVDAYAREPLTQKGMSEPQISGSAATFAHKYALNNLLLLDDSKDIDSSEPDNSVGELASIKLWITTRDIRAIHQHWDGVISKYWNDLDPSLTEKLNQLAQESPQ